MPACFSRPRFLVLRRRARGAHHGCRRPFPRPVILATLGVLGAASAACSDIDRFDNSDGSAYCGNVVGAAFVREGFIVRQRLQLELDVANLHEFPGTLTSDDQADGPCAPEATFDGAAIRVSQKLQADSLSALEFGEAREFNFMGWVDSSCEGTYLAVVSLMKNDDVEVRLMSSEAGADGSEQGKFGVFRLSRWEEKCGY